MESKLLNYSKTPIPVLVSSPSPNYEIMQSLLSKSSDIAISQPLSSSSSSSTVSPSKCLARSYNTITTSLSNSLNFVNNKNKAHKPTTNIIVATPNNTNTNSNIKSNNGKNSGTNSSKNTPSLSSSASVSMSLAKKQEKSFIRNTINLINNHSSRTIAKDLVLSATRKHKAAHRAQRNLLISENSHLGFFFKYFSYSIIKYCI